MRKAGTYHGPSVVSCSNGAKPLLPCSVPECISQKWKDHAQKLATLSLFISKRGTSTSTPLTKSAVWLSFRPALLFWSWSLSLCLKERMVKAASDHSHIIAGGGGKKRQNVTWDENKPSYSKRGFNDDINNALVLLFIRLSWRWMWAYMEEYDNLSGYCPVIRITTCVRGFSKTLC